ncbi:MAG TPA: hypothetical protein VGM30_24890 [Puia sp.]|jgi:hypothetical protein
MKNLKADPVPQKGAGLPADDLTDLEIMLSATIDLTESKPPGYFLEKYGHILPQKDIEILRQKYEVPADGK